MKNKTIFQSLLVITLSYFAYKFVFSPSDKKLILNSLVAMSDLASYENKLTKPQTLGRVNKAKNYIGDNIQLVAYHLGEVIFEADTFETIQKGAFVGTNYLDTHAVDIEESNIEVAGTHAEVHILFTSSGSNKADGTFVEYFSTDMTFIKIEKKWLLKKILATRLDENFQ